MIKVQARGKTYALSVDVVKGVVHRRHESGQSAR
jgi:glycerol-3-phosphate responsive antiterminator